MNPVLQFFLKAFASAGGFPISMMATLISQLCVEAEFCGIESE